ncbi:LTA synthase family protein [Acutalibacter intestini]|uniref:LTA synthase family protein n=1 Tax=Acutalibacter intestini TaxID=3093659 RepID=UPI002AC94C98|nr:LTA synthase family protein [Acutalibacter sp. M00204]
MKGKVHLRLERSRRNLFAAGALLVVSVAFFAVEWPLAFMEDGAGKQTPAWWYIFTYSGLTAASAVLCLTGVDLPPGIRQSLGWLMLLVLPLGSFIAVDAINGTRLWEFPQARWLANYLCYLLVFALAFGLTRRAWAAAAIGGAVSIIFGIANYFVVQFRGQPILPWDFTSFATALMVSGGYEYAPTRKMAVAALGYICSVILCAKLVPKDGLTTTRRFRLTERLTAFGVSAALAFVLFPLNGLENLGISVWAWNQKASSELTGIAAGFFANVQFMLVDKPEGYSPAKVEELAAGAPAPRLVGSPSGLPTIVAIMNESTTDFGSFGTLEFSQDNQPMLHALQNTGNCIFGKAYSSVYGGNTCNSEYEFLTSNSMAFLPAGSKPYQQYVDSPQTALPSILKEYGYHSVAVHPGDRKAWERVDAYPCLGFDEFVDAEIFDVKRTFEHRLTSDKSCYDQLIYEYERWRGEPLFLFGVTIQNHGGYEDEAYRARVRHVQVKGHEGKWPQAEQYLTLTNRADQALSDLLSYFERQPDPVVVLYFGDHWPKLEEGFTRALLKDKNGFEYTMSQYQVPFFIWANYPLEGEEIEAVSLNYLSGLLLRAAGLEGNAYTNYLEQLRQTLPVVTAIGHMDSQGNLYRQGAATPYRELLNEYAVMQYNNAFDEEGRVTEVFGEAKAPIRVA